jgi:hypothetical protein
LSYRQLMIDKHITDGQVTFDLGFKEYGILWELKLYL